MKMDKLVIAFCAFLAVACNKELDLAAKYDNTQSSVVPDESENYNPEIAGEWDQFTLSEKSVVSQEGIDMKGYWPDGKISVLQMSEGRYVCFWGEKYSYRTMADTPYPEKHISMVQVANRVFGQGINDVEGFSDGGGWLTGVYPLKDGRMAGFFHAESHWRGNSGGHAYKSIGVAYSSDGGVTWTKGDKILNVDYLKPQSPQWSGLGDGCVVFNSARNQFICYYSANDGSDYKICMAVSDDPAGASGTWKKWDGVGFTGTGYDSATDMGGKDVSIVGLRSVAGANPSVMWNKYRQKWIMVYASWSKILVMSFSEDGITWSNPIEIIGKNFSEAAGYPNLISSSGDAEGAKIVHLYYASNQRSNGTRDLAHRVITYK